MNKKFQVFVSSTFSDLRSERQACVEAILTAGHIPAGMELFSAGDESQLEIIKRWINESDIYMLLLGGRYGSIEPKSDISYTEIEYRYALESGKPMFALIMHDNLLNQKIKVDGKCVLELSNPQKFEEFKKLVLSKISKFFENEDQLKFGVIQSLLNIQNRHTLIGWIRADQSVDSVMVLNQISSLTEKNRNLQIELDEVSKKLEALSSDEITTSLSDEAKTLVLNIAEDEDGVISKAKINRNLVIKTNGKTFPIEQTARERAIWDAALNELISSSIVEEYIETTIGSLLMNSKFTNKYSLTKFGYKLADKLEIELEKKT